MASQRLDQGGQGANDGIASRHQAVDAFLGQVAQA
jgi:hypothetical protein